MSTHSSILAARCGRPKRPCGARCGGADSQWLTPGDLVARAWATSTIRAIACACEARAGVGRPLQTTAPKMTVFKCAKRLSTSLTSKTLNASPSGQVPTPPVASPGPRMQDGVQCSTRQFKSKASDGYVVGSGCGGRQSGRFEPELQPIARDPASSARRLCHCASFAPPLLTSQHLHLVSTVKLYPPIFVWLSNLHIFCS